MSSFVRKPNRIGNPSLFKTDLLYSNAPSSVTTRKATGDPKFQGSFTFTAVSNATGIWNANSNLSSSFATAFSADVVQIEDAVATLGFGFTTIASATAVFKASATLESSSTLSATCATGGEQAGVAELTSSFSFTADATEGSIEQGEALLGFNFNITADATEGSIEQGEALLSSTFTAVADGGVGSTQSGESSLSSSFTSTANASPTSPIELSSIVTWWDAKAGRTVDSSTPPRLTSWVDRAGSSQQTLTRWNAGSTDRAPEYSATGGALNGPIIDFNGTSHSMYVVDDTILSDTKASIFLLAKLDSNKQQTLFSNQFGKTDNTDGKGFAISQNSTGELRLLTNHTSSNLSRETQDAVDLTSWTLIEVYYDTGWEVKINGTTPALETNNTSQANLPPVHTSGDMTLFGTGNYASSGFVGGLISDAVFYNEKLSTSNQLIVRNYLKKKQGLNIESATATLEASFSTTADADIFVAKLGEASLSCTFTSTQNGKLDKNANASLEVSSTITAGGETATFGACSLSSTFSASADATVTSPLSNSYSMEFDGTNDRCTTSFDHDGFKDSGFTISVWLNADSFPSSGDMWAIGTYGGGNNRFGIGFYGGGYFKLWAGNGNWYDLSHGMSTGTWYNVVLAMQSWDDGHYMKAYKNGSFMDDYEVALWTASTSREGPNIGSLNLATSLYHFDGKIDEVAIWDKELTSSEIATLYNSGTPLDLSTNVGNYSSSGDLHSWWRFEDNSVSGSGGTIVDSSGNSNSATTVNGPTFSSTTPS